MKILFSILAIFIMLSSCTKRFDISQSYELGTIEGDVTKGDVRFEIQNIGNNEQVEVSLSPGGYFQVTANGGDFNYPTLRPGKYRYTIRVISTFFYYDLNNPFYTNNTNVRDYKSGTISVKASTTTVVRYDN